MERLQGENEELKYRERSLRKCWTEERNDHNRRARICDELEHQLLTSAAHNAKLREALKPFGSGIDILPWGKIKAHLPVDLAKSITKFNYAADEALSRPPEQPTESNK